VWLQRGAITIRMLHRQAHLASSSTWTGHNWNRMFIHGCKPLCLSWLQIVILIHGFKHCVRIFQVWELPHLVTTAELKFVIAPYRTTCALLAGHLSRCSWVSSISSQSGHLDEASWWMFTLWLPVLFYPLINLLVCILVLRSSIRYARPSPSISIDSQMLSSLHAGYRCCRKFRCVPWIWNQVFELYFVVTLWPLTDKLAFVDGKNIGSLLGQRTPMSRYSLASWSARTFSLPSETNYQTPQWYLGDLYPIQNVVLTGEFVTTTI
jgi:hypothetical protein